MSSKTSQNKRLEHNTQKLCLVFVEQMKLPVHQIHYSIIHIKLPEHLVIINVAVKLSHLLLSEAWLSTLSIYCGIFAQCVFVCIYQE